MLLFARQWVRFGFHVYNRLLPVSNWGGNDVVLHQVFQKYKVKTRILVQYRYYMHAICCRVQFHIVGRNPQKKKEAKQYMLCMSPSKMFLHIFAQFSYLMLLVMLC